MTQGVCKANHFAVLETPKHNDFDHIDENFENFNSILYTFQETHDFLILRDSVIICIYLSSFKKIHRQTFSWSERRPSLYLKITKIKFGPII